MAVCCFLDTVSWLHNPRNTLVRLIFYGVDMPNLSRVTILQPDPQVPIDRFGPWLASNRVLVRAIPLWRHELPAVTALGDGVIVLGGTMSAHDGAEHSWLEPLKQRMVELVEADVPVLAICLGHQLLAEAFGGEVTVAEPNGGEHGVFSVSWTGAATVDPLLALVANTPAHTSLFAESHSDVVTKLPTGAALLGSSAAYRNQAFRLGSAVGVQFHPEASPELMGRWAELDGNNAREMRRRVQAKDSDLSRNGRLLASSFCTDLRSRARAA